MNYIMFEKDEPNVQLSMLSVRVPHMLQLRLFPARGLKDCSNKLLLDFRGKLRSQISTRLWLIS